MLSFNSDMIANEKLQWNCLANWPKKHVTALTMQKQLFPKCDKSKLNML